MLLGPHRPSQKPVWSVDLTSHESIARAGGVLTGAPKVDQSGLVLNGTTQYAKFPILADYPFRTGYWCAFIDVVPTFASDDGVAHTFFTTSTNSVVFTKNTLNQLYLRSGADQAYLAYASWSPYYKRGERNQFVVYSGISGYGSQIWLNGVAVWNGSGNYGTLTAAVSDLYVGASSVGASPFAGTIQSLWFGELSSHLERPTAQEVQDSYRRQTFDLASRASLWCDMATATQDRSGTYDVTIDRSKHGRLVKLGDGTTASTFPQFKNPGFQYAAGDYITSTGAAVAEGDTFTFVMACRPDFFPGDGTQYCFFDVATKNRLFLQGNGQLYATIKGTDNFMSPTYEHWNPYGFNVLIYTVARTALSKKVYFNGHEVISTGVTASLTDSGSDVVYIGSASIIASHFIGTIYAVGFFDFVLTPTQARELAADLANEYGRLTR